MIVNLTMIDRSFLKEVPNLWVLPHDFNDQIKVGEEIVFMHLGEVFLRSKIVAIEEKGQCSDPKFEYFINYRKVWYGKKPTVVKADWSKISPIARVSGVPNDYRGVIRKVTKGKAKGKANGRAKKKLANKEPNGGWVQGYANTDSMQ